jgi:Ca2+-binding RTX toxin-like protein
MEDLLFEFPNVVAWVAGHSHQNKVDAYPNPDGPGGFWSIRVAAEADWPIQGRLLEIFDNDDGTLSIFGTIVDAAAPATSPAPGTDVAGADAATIASIGRTIGFNDPQYGSSEDQCGNCEGVLSDRNVELLVADPRESSEPGPGPGPGPGGGSRCGEPVIGTSGNDRLVGTGARERLVGRQGNDRVSGRGGRDCLRGGRGKDRLRGGDGNDRMTASSGNDRLAGGKGRDRMRGGSGADRINAMDGARDKVFCGRGDDFVKADFEDVLKDCERGVTGGP